MRERGNPNSGERSLSLQDIQWREMFLFTRIFRTFRIAVRPSKILLALAAMLMMYCGGRVMDSLWPQDQVDAGYRVRQDLNRFDEIPAVHKPFMSLMGDELNYFNDVTSAVIDMRWGYPSGVPKAMAHFAVETPVNYWRGNKVYFSVLFAWFLLVWAVFGGAICRIAAVHVARDEVISPVRALQFSVRALPSFLAAPLIPLLMVMGLGAAISVMGMVMYIPYAGPMLGGVLLVIPIILALLMTVLVIGSIAGSSLMYPTIAVEGSDAFDAVSRALSHVFAAPWRLLFYNAVAIVYGTLTYFFVRLCAFVVLALVHFFYSWFVTGDAASVWLSMWPGVSFDRLIQEPRWQELPAFSGTIGAGIITFWTSLVIASVGAFVISFYFSASTIIYLLMRRKVDATEMDAVYMEPADELPPVPAAGEAKVAGVSPTATP